MKCRFIKFGIFTFCQILLIASIANSSSTSLLFIGHMKSSEAQQLATDSPSVVQDICSDGLPPFSNNTCPDGNTPQMTAADQISQNESFQLQPPSQDSNLSQSPEEIQMDLNGDGVVDEFESQNQADIAGQTAGSPSASPLNSCEGQVSSERQLARNTLEVADQNAKDFVRLLQAGGGIKNFPTTNLYWFAKLYYYTTYLEIRDLDKVSNPAMVAHFIPIFFDLYKKAIDSYQNRDKANVPSYWMAHFKPSQDAKVSLTGAQISIETGAKAHIQGDMPKAFVQAYKSFTAKYCPDNPPPLDYFREGFFSPNALKVFPESQATLFTEIARTIGPVGLSTEKTQLALELGSRGLSGLDLETVYKWREDAWNAAKKELGQ
jgi:hypothetical protein